MIINYSTSSDILYMQTYYIQTSDTIIKQFLKNYNITLTGGIKNQVQNNRV